MARPIMLLSEKMLSKLDQLTELGVKYETMIRQQDLSLTSTTLKKKLILYSAMANSSGELRDRIHASLFPEWLDPEYMDIQTQNPKEWKYHGQMPYGTWERCDRA